MKKSFLKKSIVLSIVPVFVLAGCSNNEDQARLAVPNTDSEVSVNQDGSYTQAEMPSDGIDAAPLEDENAQKLLSSYDEAKEKGYTGTLDEWIALVQLHETNPEAAQAQAKDSGFDGGDVLMGALAGAAVGAMLASSSGTRSGLASNSYSAQRYNNTNNYAYSRPKEEERRSSGGSTYAGSATTAATSSNLRSSNKPSTPTTTTTTTKSAPTSYSSGSSSGSSYTSSRPTASYSSVSRGGFGGAVSSGG